MNSLCNMCLYVASSFPWWIIFVSVDRMEVHSFDRCNLYFVSSLCKKLTVGTTCIVRAVKILNAKEFLKSLVNCAVKSLIKIY